MRELGEIVNEMNAAIEAEEVLSDIKTESRFDPWGAVKNAFASIIYLVLQVFEEYKSDVKSVAAQSYGRAEWYIQKAYSFQLGDSLVFDERKGLVYNTVDTDKQIIKYASLITLEGQVFFKIAKEVNGLPSQLSPSELNQFALYLSKIAPVGVFINPVSSAADSISIELNVYYNTLEDTILLEQKVYDVINVYLKNLPFNGRLLSSAIIDSVQGVLGVQDVGVVSINGRASGGVYAPIERFYIPEAGYIFLDTNNTVINLIIDELV